MTADVVVEKFKAGGMEQLGLGYQTLKALNPRFIYCAISGYDRVDSEAYRLGYDLMQAKAFSCSYLGARYAVTVQLAGQALRLDTPEQVEKDTPDLGLPASVISMFPDSGSPDVKPSGAKAVDRASRRETDAAASRDSVKRLGDSAVWTAIWVGLTAGFACLTETPQTEHRLAHRA